VSGEARRGPRRLYRSRGERMIAGICGGIARYMDADPTVVRLLYVVISVLSVAVPGTLVYLVLWVVVPLEPRDGEAYDAGSPGSA
jgi:phage shock protein C